MAGSVAAVPHCQRLAGQTVANLYSQITHRGGIVVGRRDRAKAEPKKKKQKSIKEKRKEKKEKQQDKAQLFET